MKQNFDLVFRHLLASEGGYTNDPRDRGGPTRWGVTLEVLRVWRKDDTLTAKDVKALIAIADSYGYDFTLLKAVHEVNKQARITFVDKIVRHFNSDLAGKTIAVLGLSFKPNTDDMRDAPSISIIEELIKRGVHVVAYDPVAMQNN